MQVYSWEYGLDKEVLQRIFSRVESRSDFGGENPTKEIVFWAVNNKYYNYIKTDGKTLYNDDPDRGHFCDVYFFWVFKEGNEYRFIKGLPREHLEKYCGIAFDANRCEADREYWNAYMKGENGEVIHLW